MLFSEVLNINIDEESNNDIFYETNTDLPLIDSNTNNSNNSFFSCESDKKLSTESAQESISKSREVVEIDVKKDSVIQSIIEEEVVFGSDEESVDKEIHWSETSEESHNVSLNESYFNDNSINDRSISDELKAQELIKLMDKSKHLLQILENNMFERKELDEKQRLSQLNNSKNEKNDSQLDSESDKSYNTRNSGTKKYNTRNSSSSGQRLSQINGKSWPPNDVRRSLRKRNSSVLNEPENYESMSSDNSRDSFEPEKDVSLKQKYFNGSQIDIRQPFLFSGGLMRDYQLEGLDWLKLLNKNDMNGILADEMGLGKTIQCIALIADLIENDKTGGCLGPYLVVAPLTTLHNWKNEFERFAPLIPTLVFHGDKKHRKELRKLITKSANIYAFNDRKQCYPVVITSYEMIKFEIFTMKKYDWNYVIIDEGHKIKNINCQLSKMMRLIKTKNRLLLTGTPLHNSLLELWSLLNYLSPEIFNDSVSRRIFEEWLETNTSDEQIIEQEKQNKIISAMHQILTPFMLRRTKQEVGLNLPPKKEVLIYAPSTLTQQTLYETAINLVREGKSKNDYFTINCDLSEGRKRRKSLKVVNYAQFDLEFEEYFEEDFDDSFLNASQRVIELPKELITDENSPQYVSFGRFTKNNIMMQMRKITNHPFLVQWPINPKTGDVIVNNDIIRTSGKMRALDELLSQLYVRKNRVLLFSQMTKMLDIIEDYCSFRRYRYLRLDGSTKLDIRREYIQNFNTNDDIFLFLISTRAGGLGINLIGADTAIIYDSDWNPQMDLQAQDRCHRIGQSKPVIIYRLVTANTIDEHMVKTANSKRKLDKMIIQKGHYFRASDQFIENKFKGISLEELLNVLQSTDFKAIYNYSSEKLETDRLFSDEDLKKMMDRTEESEDSIIEIGAQNNSSQVIN